MPMLAAEGEAWVYDFSTNIVPGSTERDHGYWRDVGTIDAYFDAHMDLVSVTPVFNLYNDRWPIYTLPPQLPPAKFVLGGRAEESMVSAGAIIGGGSVHNSVVSPGVRVERGARVEDSVLMDGVYIGEGAYVRRAILDKNTVVPPWARIGVEHGRRQAAVPRQRGRRGRARQGRPRDRLTAGSTAFMARRPLSCAWWRPGVRCRWGGRRTAASRRPDRAADLPPGDRLRVARRAVGDAAGLEQAVAGERAAHPHEVEQRGQVVGVLPRRPGADDHVVGAGGEPGEDLGRGAEDHPGAAGRDAGVREGLAGGAQLLGVAVQGGEDAVRCACRASATGRPARRRCRSTRPTARRCWRRARPGSPRPRAPPEAARSGGRPAPGRRPSRASRRRTGRRRRRPRLCHLPAAVPRRSSPAEGSGGAARPASGSGRGTARRRPFLCISWEPVCAGTRAPRPSVDRFVRLKRDASARPVDAGEVSAASGLRS